MAGAQLLLRRTTGLNTIIPDAGKSSTALFKRMTARPAIGRSCLRFRVAPHPATLRHLGGSRQAPAAGSQDLLLPGPALWRTNTHFFRT